MLCRKVKDLEQAASDAERQHLHETARLEAAEETLRLRLQAETERWRSEAAEMAAQEAVVEGPEVAASIQAGIHDIRGQLEHLSKVTAALAEGWSLPSDGVPAQSP